MAILVTTEPGGRQASWKLGADEITIGRAPESGLVIDETFVSRQHAVIAPVKSNYSIRDLGSKNGTWVNGKKIGGSPETLRDGDSIHFGSPDASLRFVEDDRTVTLTVPASESGLRVDNQSREVFLDGSMIVPRLTRKEFDILNLLWERRTLACSRDQIAASGWPERPEGDVSDTEIEQYIRRLRRHIGDSGRQPDRLVTVRGFGYKLL